MPAEPEANVPIEDEEEEMEIVVEVTDDQQVAAHRR